MGILDNDNVGGLPAAINESVAETSCRPISVGENDDCHAFIHVANSPRAHIAVAARRNKNTALFKMIDPAVRGVLHGFGG